MKPSEPSREHDPKSQVVAQPLPHLSSKEIAALEGTQLSDEELRSKAQLDVTAKRAEEQRSKADADALAARDRVRSAVTILDDGRVVNLIHQVDGRTTVIARELEGDAAVLEQLAAQLRLDARDLRVVTPAQTQVIDAAVARLRAFAAQLVALCASRDIPLPQVPTLPAPLHVPPPRA